MTAEPEQNLFRHEAIEARRTRVEGEIVLTQPMRIRGSAYLLFALLGAAAAWLMSGEYTRNESARGILVTDVPSAKVMALEAGQVTDLLVRDGDIVRAGQHLVSIRTEQPSESGGSAVDASLAALETQHGIVSEQVKLAAVRAESERARVAAVRSGLRQQRSDLSAQVALQKEVVASARETFQSVQSIVDKGFISRVEVQRRKQAYLVAQQDLARLEQQLNSLISEEGRASAEVARIEVDERGEIVSALSIGQTLAQQKAKLQRERAYIIRAPIAGRVTALQAAVGRTTEPSVPLMTIVPDRSDIYAEIYAPTRAIGFLKPGKEVRLLYDAFPYQRFGSYRGRITAISRIVLDPSELAVPVKVDEPVYRIRVIPDRQVVNAFGEAYPLQPGMSVTANIILDKGSFLDWLLTPVNAVMKRNQ
jgi:membrane fusion protein